MINQLNLEYSQVKMNRALDSEPSFITYYGVRSGTSNLAIRITK